MSGNPETYSKGTEDLLLQRTRPRPIPAEYDRAAEGIPPGPILGGAGLRMKVTAVENDYLVCSQLDADGNVTATGIKIAKPPELRHDADWYECVNQIWTIDEQTMKVGTTAPVIYEIWFIKPPYIVDQTEIVAIAAPAALGMVVDEVALTLIDANVAGRAWSIPE